MDSTLQKLQEEIASEVGATVAGLSVEQLSWHPPGKWCVAEILEHLYLTYTGTVKGFERVAPPANRWAQRKAGRSVGGPW